MTSDKTYEITEVMFIDEYNLAKTNETKYCQKKLL